MQPTRDPNGRTVILIVDDDQDNLQLLDYQVSLLISCSTLNASNGQNAMLLAEQSLPDLILMDIMLPDMDGFEIVRCLKQNQPTKHIPIIAVTAMARSQDQEAAIEAGYDDYLCKPYELESLEALLYRYLGIACSLAG